VSRERLGEVEALLTMNSATALVTSHNTEGDIAADPDNLKYQRLQFNNPKLQEILWNVAGTGTLLDTCGYGALLFLAARPP
jgi:hypothetical protein